MTSMSYASHSSEYETKENYFKIVYNAIIAKYVGSIKEEQPNKAAHKSRIY